MNITEILVSSAIISFFLYLLSIGIIFISKKTKAKSFSSRDKKTEIDKNIQEQKEINEAKISPKQPSIKNKIEEHENKTEFISEQKNEISDYQHKKNRYSVMTPEEYEKEVGKSFYGKYNNRIDKEFK